ncbi:MAG TPA: ABC transporter permease [Candidatus Didemnitutus sp.]|nr:ABC transporter permease [Candidatus Didemnitutus sp.]
MTPGLDRLVARIRALFQRGELDRDFEAEMEHHVAMKSEEYRRAGLDEAEALRRARAEFGGTTQAREMHREARGLPALEEIGRDLGFAFRVWRRERRFAAIALLILMVGIGLNTTVFSLVNTVLLRPVPFANADRLVFIHNWYDGISFHDLSGITSQIPTWEGLQEANRSLEQIEAYDPFSVRQTYRLTGSGEPESILGLNVSPGLFPLLGVAPQLGRLLRNDDANKDAPGRIILSDQLWRRRYNADPSIVGRTIQINGEAVEVIGVMPRIDAFSSAFFPAVRVDFFQALRKEVERSWGNVVIQIGRAKPGLSIDAVRADLNLALALAKKHDSRRDQYCTIKAMPLQEWISGNLRRPLIFLWVAAGLVLGIVCFNLGGLLLARGAARRRELAVRSALGAARGRLARQILTECGLLVAVGSLLGATLAAGFIRFLSIRSAVEIPLLQSLHLDATALAFTVLVGAATAFLCGALPAWRLARVDDLQESLREDARGTTGGRERSRTRGALVMTEVALAAILAVSAGLMVRSFFNLLRVDLGFQPRDLIAVRLDLTNVTNRPENINALLAKVQSLPGVERAGLSDCIPVERDRSWGLYPVNRENPKDQRYAGAHVRLISPGVFAAMETPLIAGRDFTSEDRKDTAQVIIVNQSLARAFWGKENPIGRPVGGLGRDNTFTTVVGVVADVRHDGPETGSGFEMYLPYTQVDETPSWDLMVRTKLPVAALTTELREGLRSIDPDVPLTKARTMQSLVDRTLSSRRLMVWLVGGFAALALLLASLGLYGIISYGVNQRTKEIGIRMALGANARVVQGQVVSETLRLALIGLGAGLAGSLLAGRLMQSLLYGVAALDVVTYLAAAVAVLGCATLAGYLPARRAARIDPMVALRAD